MKKILLIATGGTIASKRTDNGLAPLILSEELLDYVPDAREFCQVDSLQLLNLDSTNMLPEHWVMMAEAIEARYDSYDGFVICHGTDTLAFTAAALSYLIQNSPKPIIITGAQKPIDMENTDARINLTDSLRYACCGKAHDVSVVFGGKVIAGTRARKMRAKSYNAFSSINFPYLASIQDGRIVHYITSDCSGRPAFYHSLNSRVFLLKLIPGIQPDILSFIEDRYDAFIIEGYGVGGLPDDGERSFLSEVERLVQKGKIVVMATQVIHEGSDMTVYEVGHLAKEKLGLLECRDMTLEAAVAKLMWILSLTGDPVRVRAMFNTTIRYDLLFS
ncbi:MAG: asparaginase [Oscillospiraceae bacterium]|nr:asparaginase [Oscillospiraceae bacterium]